MDCFDVCECCGVGFYHHKDNSKKFKYCSKRCVGLATGGIYAAKRKKEWERESAKQTKLAILKYFNDRIEKKENSCWIWTGSKKDSGGIAIFRGKKYVASRMSWLLYRADELPKGCLMHLCKNNLCVNPEHLIFGATKVKSVCLNCGETYKVFHYYAKKSKFCSLRCRSSYGGKLVHQLIRDKWILGGEDGYKKALKIKLLENIDRKESGCWEWKKRKNWGGYGRLSFRGKQLIASRASWMAYNGNIELGKNVLHKYDNPLCVNPEHLFLGSHLDNARDKIKKNRGHKNSLTVEKVSMIKKLIQRGIPMSRLATDYGVCVGTIKCIKYGKTWKDV